LEAVASVDGDYISQKSTNYHTIVINSLSGGKPEITITVTVLDINGKQVLSKKYRVAERILFDMSDKVSGMYFIKLDFEGTNSTEKIDC